MKKRSYSLTANRQSEQFAVNLAEILVSAGLVIGAAFQAQVFFQNYQFETYYHELKMVESAVWDYKGLTGRWPGDCDADGVVDIGSQQSLEGGLAARNCSFGVRSQEAIREIFSEFESVDMLSEHLQTQFVDDGGVRMQLAHDSGFESNGQNVLVAFELSSDLAQWLDKRIDGDLAADAGRIRLWDTEENTATWPEETVTIAYYFDTKL